MSLRLINQKFFRLSLALFGMFALTDGFAAVPETSYADLLSALPMVVVCTVPKTVGPVGYSSMTTAAWLLIT